MSMAVLRLTLLLLLSHAWTASTTAESMTSEPMAASTSEPMEASTSEPMGASTSELMGSSTSEPMGASTSELMGSSTSEPMGASTSESMAASTSAAWPMTSSQVTNSIRPGTVVPGRILTTSFSPASSPTYYHTTTTPFWSTTPARTMCPEADQIHCSNSDRCTRIRYICDGDNDCGDNSDESSSLCHAWLNPYCDRNSARCTRNGRSDCITISHYCNLSNPPCNGTVDPRLCQMLHDGKIQVLQNIQLPTTTPEPTEPPTTMPSIHLTEELWTDEFLFKVNHTIRHPDCPQLYTRVGNQCISVFFIGSLNWLESRAFCQTIGGDLFTTDKDLTNFATILQHLTSNKMTTDFWVGGRYMNETVGWNWVNTTPMPHGSPYWAVRHQEECQTREVTYSILNRTIETNNGDCYHYTQSPKTPPVGHCTALTYKHYYYITDEECFAKKSPLCVLPAEHPKQAL